MSQREQYLLDTHALIFWEGQHSVSNEFVIFLDELAKQGSLFVSSISFWETALLIQKNRLSISDVHTWKDGILANTGLRLLNPSATEMINSVQLPNHHKDPFDRLLIAQAQANNLILITRDNAIEQYDIETFWMQ
ncbi:MAG: type II toxin-antitoxin system VapC family toxin [Caldilineaceae bacterium]